MTDDLFPEAHQPSPKLRWLAKHGVVVKSPPYRAYLTDETFGSGEDEETAIIDLCLKTGLKHYSQE